MERTLACAFVVLLLAGCSGKAPPVPRDPDAFQVPALAEAPRLDRRILDGEWDGAATIQGTFLIRDGTEATDAYPFELKLGHDDTWLFALATMRDVPENPFNDKTPGKETWHGFGLNLFLDSALEAPLKAPADWKGFLNLREYGTDISDGFWNGDAWEGQTEGSSPPGAKLGDDDRPTAGTWGRGFYEGDDLHWEIFIPLKSANKEHDGFQAGRGGVFRMGLLFEVQGKASPDAEWPVMGPHDTWPGEGYTPRNHYDPSTWMRMQLA